MKIQGGEVKAIRTVIREVHAVMGRGYHALTAEGAQTRSPRYKRMNNGRGMNELHTTYPDKFIPVQLIL